MSIIFAGCAGIIVGIIIAALLNANKERDFPENYVLRGKFGKPRGLKEIQRRQRGK